MPQGNLLPVEPVEISIVPRNKKYSGDISPTHFQTNHTQRHTDLSDHITTTNEFYYISRSIFVHIEKEHHNVIKTFPWRNNNVV